VRSAGRFAACAGPKLREVEGRERDSTQDWLLPAGAAPPLMSELAHRVDEALAIAKASEAAALSIGAAATEAAEQARRAAEMAERAARSAELATGIEPSGRGPSPAAGPANGMLQGPVPGPRGRPPIDPLDERLERFARQADRVMARLREIESAVEPTAP